MKKLSDYKDGEALDLLADIIEPASAIFSDKEVLEAFKSNNKFAAVKVIIKSHKNELIEVLARLDGKEVSEYHCNVFTIPIVALQVLQDQELIDFFLSAVVGKDESVYTEPTPNTEGTETN